MIELGVVNVLGTNYTIFRSNKSEDETLANSDGYCDYTVKQIVIGTFEPLPDSLKDLKFYEQKVIRHELVHAFLFESGLSQDTWAGNEEIVDWIAFQIPKMIEVLKALQI